LSPELKPDIEPDSHWRQNMGQIPTTDDDSFSVHEVHVGSRPVVREVLETIALTLIIFLIVRTVTQNFVVEGTSMDPTLHDTQSLIVNKAAYFQWEPTFLERLNPLPQGAVPPPSLTYAFGAPQRGDIVVFHAPEDPRDFIKRIIGLPGETVEVRANDGVYVNSVKLNEPYIKDVANYDWPDPGASATVPMDKIFVLGDNRRNSDDSHVFGPIALSSVVGRAWISYWPPEFMGILPHPTYSAP